MSLTWEAVDMRRVSKLESDKVQHKQILHVQAGHDRDRQCLQHVTKEVSACEPARCQAAERADEVLTGGSCKGESIMCQTCREEALLMFRRSSTGLSYADDCVFDLLWAD